MHRAACALLLVLVAGCGRQTVVNDWYLAAPRDQESRSLLVITEYGGAASDCTRFASHEVEETADAVTVSVLLSVKRGRRECTDELVVQEVEVRLAEPLGSRRLAGCGRASCDDAGPPGT